MATRPRDGTAAGEGREGGEHAGGSGIAQDVRDVVGATVGAIARAGTVSAANIAEAVEGAGRSLTRRVITGALDTPRPLRDQHQLAQALAEQPTTPVLASAASAALMARTLSRFRVLNFLTRRTPMWIAAGLVPTLIVSVSRGADELGMVASHLARRARAEGIEPDPERLRRASIQVLSGAPIDPDVEPGHGSLVVAWAKRAIRAALPFASGVRTRDPEGLAAVAADVDPKVLAPAAV